MKSMFSYINNVIEYLKICRYKPGKLQRVQNCSELSHISRIMIAEVAREDYGEWRSLAEL